MIGDAYIRKGVLVWIAAIALIESIVAWVVYQPWIQKHDWDVLAAALKGSSSPVLLSQPWLDPRARMHIATLQDPRDVGLPDPYGDTEFRVVSLGTSWVPPDVQQALRDPSDLSHWQQTHVGPWVIDDYRWSRRHQRIGQLDHPIVRTNDGTCRRHGEGWICEDETRVQETWVEVDYQPRRCWSIDGADGVTVSLRQEMGLGTELRGHLGFHDFNGRLRNDGPAKVEIRIDEQSVYRAIAADASGWQSLLIETTPRREATIEVHVTISVGGQWGTRGYSTIARRPLCLELRALQIGGDL